MRLHKLSMRGGTAVEKSRGDICMYAGVYQLQGQRGGEVTGRIGR